MHYTNHANYIPLNFVFLHFFEKTKSMHSGHSDWFPCTCILNDKNFPFALLLFSVFQSYKFLLILSLTDTSRAGPGQNAYGPQSCRYANSKSMYKYTLYYSKTCLQQVHLLWIHIKLYWGQFHSYSLKMFYKCIKYNKLCIHVQVQTN